MTLFSPNCVERFWKGPEGFIVEDEKSEAGPATAPQDRAHQWPGRIDGDRDSSDNAGNNAEYAGNFYQLLFMSISTPIITCYLKRFLIRHSGRI